jgi:hypothetical protein
MKTLARILGLGVLTLGLCLPTVGCIVETDTPNDNVIDHPIEGGGELEIEGEGGLDD